MKFDLDNVVKKIDTFSPTLSKKLVIQYLNLISPFNGHLRCELIEWSFLKSKIKVGLKKRVKNHLGGVHAGALFTLGETCAGILLIKNFSPQKFRLILKDASIVYLKQARETVYGECEFSQSTLDQFKMQLAQEKPAFIEAYTVIKNAKNEELCQVKTQWQLKTWDQVKIKNQSK